MFAEIFRIIVLAGMLFIAFYFDLVFRPNGSLEITMLPFFIVPIFFIGKSFYNIYRNIKYRKK